MSDDDDDSLDAAYEDPSLLEPSPDPPTETAAIAPIILKTTRRSKTLSSSSRTRPVVKLVVTSVTRSYSEPWRRRTQREGNGTGFLILWNADDGDRDEKTPTRRTVRIVTNAHVVRNASSVRARSSFGPHVVNCCVEWVSLPLDLALVKIVEGDWDDFCRGWGWCAEGVGGDVEGGLTCLNLSNTLPSLDSNVTCVGFPMGGKQISVTRGVISRIDVDTLNVLRIQIDAAINPGNSGGPVFDEQGQVVGVSTSVIRNASNIGYIIPGKVVHMFLQMCADGMEASIEDRFCGLGSLVARDEERGMVTTASAAQVVGGSLAEEPKHVPGITNLAILGAQNLESKALRRHLGLDELDLTGGVRIVGGRPVKEVINTISGNGETSLTIEEDQEPNGCDRLQCNDVLLAINDTPIGYDGTIQLSPTRPDERINFRVLVTCQRVGTKMMLDVLRDKKRQQLEVTLDSSRFLVPQYDDFDACPLYAVCGGCVFSPLTLPLINEKKSTNKALAFSSYFKQQRSGHEQIMVLSKVLNDEVNVGYHGWTNMLLKSVNGYTCRNIQELVDVLTMKIQGETVEFHFQNSGNLAEEEADWVICMNMQEVIRSESRILSRHMIAGWCSIDAISRELYSAVEKADRPLVEKNTCWSTMRGLRKVLGDGNL